MLFEFSGQARPGVGTGHEVRYQAISAAHGDLFSQVANPRVNPGGSSLSAAARISGLMATASVITAPSAGTGCWQVTGLVGRVALTFVTFVIKGRRDFGAAQSRCGAGRVL